MIEDIKLKCNEETIRNRREIDKMNSLLNVEKEGGNQGDVMKEEIEKLKADIASVGVQEIGSRVNTQLSNKYSYRTPRS